MNLDLFEWRWTRRIRTRLRRRISCRLKLSRRSNGNLFLQRRKESKTVIVFQNDIILLLKCLALVHPKDLQKLKTHNFKTNHPKTSIDFPQSSTPQRTAFAKCGNCRPKKNKTLIDFSAFEGCFNAKRGRKISTSLGEKLLP